MTTDKDKTDAGKKKKKKTGLRRWVFPLASVTVLGGAAVFEANTSFFLSKYFRSVAEGKVDTEVQKGDCSVAPPAAGPVDERLGYTHALEYRKRLEGKGFELTCDAPYLKREVLGIELFPIYDEKYQAGLRILDDTGAELHTFDYPLRTYKDFDSLPPLMVKTLLLVENRKLLADNPASQNPAIEWERFFAAMFEYGVKKPGQMLGISQKERAAGGSTLATQIEKFRHSPDGITGSPVEKLRQMSTASVRSYMDGTETVAHRRDLVLNYINAVPLSAYQGFGDVTGFADGFALWFGRDYKEATELLNKPVDKLTDAELREVAKVYRETLALVMAVKQPSTYFLRNRQELENRIDAYLRDRVDDDGNALPPLLIETGIIDARLRDAVLKERLSFTDPKNFTRIRSTAEQKSAQALQVGLMETLGIKGLYELNRTDVTAHATIDAHADAAINSFLRKARNPDFARANGLVGYQLLSAENAGDVDYSFILNERMADGTNVVRVQTDTYDGPFNMNEGGKVELGSTAKKRTLITYLESFEELQKLFSGMTRDEIRALKVSPRDKITADTVRHFLTEGADTSPEGVIEMALARVYSGNPHEQFFTAGGLHTFSNFTREENGRSFTVTQALQKSNNLTFIRMMRDIVFYTQAHKMDIEPDIFENPDSPQRKFYIQQFADAEGRQFLWKHWNEMKDLSGGELGDFLAGKTNGAPAHLAVVYRSVYPEAPAEAMMEFIKKHCTKCAVEPDYAKLYEDYAPGKFNLNDRGYITNIHPLQLWLAGYRYKSPEAKWEEAATASAAERIEVYKWLIESTNMQAQNSRISTMLEKEAFVHIHKSWARLGYPFDKLVASYATSIGVSGDKPAALTALDNILQNDGMRMPVLQIRSVTLADGTPYKTQADFKAEPGERVLSPEIAKAVRRELQGVVEHGTARRAFQSVKLGDGRVLPVGGKTGTGDNRRETYARGGAVTSSVAVSRTATFTFIIDDRFYGTITAYVQGEKADNHNFTSGLTTQIFKMTMSLPEVKAMFDRSYGIEPAPANDAPKADAAKPAQPPKPTI